MLDNRVLLGEIRDVYSKVGNLPLEEITEGDWLYLYDIYKRAYPMSNGQPSREELIKILEKASQLKTAYR